MGGDVMDQSIERIGQSLIYNDYWKMILGGLKVTVTICFFGIIMAFAIAILMCWMNRTRYLKYVSKPLTSFIKTIHDVPSVVLIFFFYYVVFSAVKVGGIFVCIVALAVYTSGSFIKIIDIGLSQVDLNQHYAAQMLGLSGWKKYRYVILPQAVKPMVPLLAAESKVLLRATTYAGYISQMDLVKVTEMIRKETYDMLVPLVFVSIVFLILSKLIVVSLDAIYEKAFNYD
jgi:polar amino acid transport system permease protein